MAYRVKMTDYAIGQMQNAAAYIAHDLYAPETADKWVSRMQKEIMTLDSMPGRIPLTGEEPWRTEGVHKMTVMNFLVYFWIEDDADIVWVTAVVYGGRDQRKVLEDMPME